jgi:hypothetical protein
MSLTYTWKLKSLRKTNTPELSDVVVQTFWECTGTDEDGDSGTFNGATPFDAQDVDGDGFITYEELTEAAVLGWIQAVVVGTYKEHIDQQIMKQINEKKMPIIEVSESQLPWAESEVVTPPVE